MSSNPGKYPSTVKNVTYRDGLLSCRVGNFTDEQNWAARIRLELVEKFLWWQGQVRRADLTSRFQISSAQASSDLQRYFELNPFAASYNTRKKLYEASSEMVCVLHVPRIEDPLAMFLGAAAEDASPHSAWPRRMAPQSAQRRLVLALLASHLVRVKITVGPEISIEREVIPGGLARWEGRWFLRAWCPAGSEWVNLPVDRILDSGWPREPLMRIPADEAWGQFEVLKLRLRRDLNMAEEMHYQLDFDLSGTQEMSVTHRRALRAEVLAHLPPGFQVAPETAAERAKTVP